MVPDGCLQVDSSPCGRDVLAALSESDCPSSPAASIMVRRVGSSCAASSVPTSRSLLRDPPPPHTSWRRKAATASASLNTRLHRQRSVPAKSRQSPTLSSVEPLLARDRQGGHEQTWFQRTARWRHQRIVSNVKAAFALFAGRARALHLCCQGLWRQPAASLAPRRWSRSRHTGATQPESHHPMR